MSPFFLSEAMFLSTAVVLIPIASDISRLDTDGFSVISMRILRWLSANPFTNLSANLSANPLTDQPFKSLGAYTMNPFKS